MKKITLILLLFLTSCQYYVTEIKDVTLSGKYVVSRLDITSVDQSNPRLEKYNNGTYINNNFGNPFNEITINNFYIHFDYSTIRMGEIRVEDGRDIWEYGMSPKEIFYRISRTTPFHSGYLEFDYISKDGSRRSMKFIIEDDGLETLQLKSTGIWPNNQFGEKQVMTLYLTRVGP